MTVGKGLARSALIVVTILACRPATASGPPSAFSVGMNVDGVNDYAVQSPFVDAMKQARHFGSPSSPWDETATVDAQGWPLQDAAAVVLCCVGDAAGHSIIAGTYALTFTGQADLALVAGSGGITGQAYDSATNTTAATVSLDDSGTGTLLALSFTNSRRLPGDAPGTGVTGVHLIRPHLAPNGKPWWHTSGQTFTAPFLALLKPFAALRTMDLTNTNGNPQTTWSTRTHKNAATQQAPGGVAWDYAIELANTLHKDIWINIPDQADDGYVTHLAAQFAASLDPALHLYLEYSNEVWNYSFPQAARNQAAAEAEVNADPNSPLAWNCTDYDSCRYQWGVRRVGERTVQIAAIFRKAFAGNSGALRPIYATQLGQTYYLSLVLPMIDHYFGDPKTLLYGVAQAPYWAGDQSLDGLTARQELKNAAANLATLSSPEQGFATWSHYYGLQSVTYEGGPGMSGTASLDAKIEANRAPAMGHQVVQAITGAASQGTSLYMYFTDAGQYGQYGMWGATEDPFDLKTPKMKALKQVIATGSVPLQGGLLLPLAFPPITPDLAMGNGFIVNDQGYAYLSEGGLYGYLVDVPADGTYSVVLSAGTYYGATTANLALDRAPIGTVSIPDTGGDLMNWTNTPPVSVQLPAGLHVLTVSSPIGEFGMNLITVGK